MHSDSFKSGGGDGASNGMIADSASQAPIIVASDDTIDASYFAKDFAHSPRVASVRASLHSVLHSMRVKRNAGA